MSENLYYIATHDRRIQTNPTTMLFSDALELAECLIRYKCISNAALVRAGETKPRFFISHNGMLQQGSSSKENPTNA